jgi:hypothetical protein
MLYSFIKKLRGNRIYKNIHRAYRGKLRVVKVINFGDVITIPRTIHRKQELKNKRHIKPERRAIVFYCYISIVQMF